MASAPLSQSDISLRKGIAALERRCFQEAISLFQTAIDQERQEGAKNPRMRHVSYLGLALTLAQGKSEEGLKLCQQAAKRDFFDPEEFCNLGMVYLRHRQKALAFDAFKKGLGLRPDHRRILEELERYDRRTYPVFSFLPRNHPLNVFVGRLRYRLRHLFNRAAPTEI